MKIKQPLKGELKITCPYGWRNHPITGKRQFHSGTDFQAAIGTLVLAVADSVVTAYYDDKKHGGGWTMVTEWSDGGDKWRAGYGHLLGKAAEIGDNVAAGTVIALSGDSGIVTGPHLHFSLACNGVKCDPMGFIDRGDNGGGNNESGGGEAGKEMDKEEDDKAGGGDKDNAPVPEMPHLVEGADKRVPFLSRIVDVVKWLLNFLGGGG